MRGEGANDVEEMTEDAEAENKMKLKRCYEQIINASRSFTGYENPGKSLYVIIRELVENSLDAIDLAMVEHPQIMILVEQVETGKRIRWNQSFKITCEDNGIGAEHDQIPKMFAELLFTSKSAHQQTRGKFGMGAKNALLYSMDNTNNSVKVASGMINQNYKSEYELKMDTTNGKALIVHTDKIWKEGSYQGTRVEFTIVGNWAAQKDMILSFMRQIAMVTPYVSFSFEYRWIKTNIDPVKQEYPRTVLEKPSSPKDAKHDPSSFFQKTRVLSACSSSITLKNFLIEKFAGIDEQMATQFVGKLGPTFSVETKMEDLDPDQIIAIRHQFKKFRFKDIDSGCLIPLGEYLLKGVKSILGDDIMLGHYTSSPNAFEGHPYMVEAVVTIGGPGTVDKGLNFFRFANRTPLLCESASDVIIQVAKKIKWDKHNIDQLEDKICIFVSFVSTYVPFTGLSKEAISGRQNIPEVIKDVLEGCCNILQELLKPQLAIKRKRHVDVATEFHMRMMRGCTKMEGEDYFREEDFCPEDAEKRTRSKYERLLDDSLNRDPNVGNVDPANDDPI